MGANWSLITVTYNSAETLRRFWHSGPPAGSEWIVVDNNSADNSVALARELGAHVIVLSANRGFGAANNVGFESASGRYVAFVNPDVTVGHGSLQELETKIDAYGGLVAPQLVNPDGTTQPNGRLAPSLSNKVLNRLRGDRGHARYRVYASPDQDLYVAWVIGAAVSARRETFVGLAGPWDDKFFLYYEDSDICLRAWQRSIPVTLAGSVNWTHGWARETKSLSWTPWKRELASMTRFYARYPTLALSDYPGSRLRAARKSWGTAARHTSSERDDVSA